MSKFTNICFNVTVYGFPKGKLYKMSVWTQKTVSDTSSFLKENEDNIKKSIGEDGEKIRSISFRSAIYTNTLNVNVEKFDEFIIESEFKPGLNTTNTTNTVKKENNKSTNIKDIDTDKLIRLKGKIEVELFKRENDLSDDFYKFYLENKDLMSLEDIKKHCKEHGSEDIYYFKKRKIKENIEKKVKI